MADVKEAPPAPAVDVAVAIANDAAQQFDILDNGGHPFRVTIEAGGGAGTDGAQRRRRSV
eukprot:m.339186 g.339186  ORF g.339186 m.339186 type:complete len:60 (-) comp27813_c1_seq1:43-222(-)